MKAVVLALVVATVLGKHEEYVGWKSYYVEPASVEELKVLGGMLLVFDLDFLAHASVGRPGVVLVKPEHQDAFTAALDHEGISYKIHADDIKAQLDIDDQLMEDWKQESRAKNTERIPYDNYQPIEVIDQYLQDMARKYPATVTLVTPAKSFHGHPIKYLKISSSNFQDTSKPVIVIEGGMHAREWISPPTVTYAIHKLVENITEWDMLDKYDWILLPVANPDGYKFSFTTTRFWRKTRSTDQNILSWLCPGVDGNRNFDFFWSTVGTSKYPCSDVFGGSKPFSEIETRVVRDILFEHLERISLFLTMHSFGSMVLYPWGHNGTLSHNALLLHLVGTHMAQAIDKKSLSHFPRYRVGNALHVLGYGASGASEDYAHSIGVPFSYTYELPGLQWGLQGFHLDPRYIKQVCEETWEGIVVGVRRSGEFFNTRK